MSTANLMPILRVETAVAIAFGASVQPFTSMTPKVRNVVRARGKLASTELKKSVNEIAIVNLRGSLFRETARKHQEPSN